MSEPFKDSLIYQAQGTTMGFLRMTKWAGYYDIDGTKFPVRKKPRWLTRFLMKHLLEWKWEDSIP